MDFGLRSDTGDNIWYMRSYALMPKDFQPTAKISRSMPRVSYPLARVLSSKKYALLFVQTRQCVE